jgi:hypothetical protein
MALASGSLCAMDDAWTTWNELALADATKLDGQERQLHAFGWLRTELNNGGFDQLFFNSAGDLVPDAVLAARAAGAPDLADLVELAMSVLGSGYQTDREKRQELLLALTEEDEDQLSELDSRYYHLEETLDLDEVMRRLGGGA